MRLRRHSKPTLHHSIKASKFPHISAHTPPDAPQGAGNERLWQGDQETPGPHSRKSTAACEHQTRPILQHLGLPQESGDAVEEFAGIPTIDDPVVKGKDEIGFGGGNK